MARSVARNGIGSLAFVGVVLCAAAGCESKPTAEADAGPTPSRMAPVAASSDASDVSHAQATSFRVPPRPLCRAVSIQGDARVTADARDAGLATLLAAEDEIAEDAWIALGRGVRLVAKDPRTTRETIFYGPGRVRACAGHREESWIALGAFESERGAGETPGAEEWVVTPHAVVKFAAAKLRVDVGPKQTTVNVANGVAFVWTAGAFGELRSHAAAGPDGGTSPNGARIDERWQRVSEGTMRIGAALAAPPLEAAGASLDQCSAIAQRSEALTRALLAPPDADGAVRHEDANTITEQVSTRELARAACDVAALHVHALAPSGARDDFEERLRGAEAAWTALPITTLTR